MAAPLVLAAVTFLLVVAAWQWVRVVVGAFRWAERALGARPQLGHGAPSPDNQPEAGPGSGSHPEGAKRPPQGVDGRGGVGYPARHYFGLGPIFILGVALQPDFESFFGGFATAVAAGGVLLVAVVVAMAIRRFTSF